MSWERIVLWTRRQAGSLSYIAPSRYLGGYVDELIDRDSLAVILQQHLATSRKFPEC
jgi:hypothetical protein